MIFSKSHLEVTATRNIVRHEYMSCIIFGGGRVPEKQMDGILTFWLSEINIFNEGYLVPSNFKVLSGGPIYFGVLMSKLKNNVAFPEAARLPRPGLRRGLVGQSTAPLGQHRSIYSPTTRSCIHQKAAIDKCRRPHILCRHSTVFFLHLTDTCQLGQLGRSRLI